MRQVTNHLFGFIFGPLAMLVGLGICLASILGIFSGKGEGVVVGIPGLAVGAVISRVGYYMFFND